MLDFESSRRLCVPSMWAFAVRIRHVCVISSNVATVLELSSFPCKAFGTLLLLITVIKVNSVVIYYD